MKTNILFLYIFFLASCSYDKVEVKPDTGYPDAIGKILVTKCAVDGCHNAASRFASAGLEFNTWDKMFDGGRNGTSVIPYSADNSFMLYSVNTDSAKGPILFPTMPLQAPSLTSEEYQTLVEWISNGAPDNKGFVKFSDDINRKKIYICMQGCDKVAVLDAKTKIIMRYINVGIDPAVIEAPHLVRVSPDGKFWYVVFYSGSSIQKFSTENDELVSSLDIGNGNWNTVIITPDGSKGFVNGTGTNTIQIVNLTTMTLETTLHSYEFPHGGFITPDGQFLYLSCQNGNFIHKIDLLSAPFYDNSWSVILAPGQQRSTSSSLDPHELIQTPDGTKYFVSCQTSNEIRVFQTSNDSLLAIIPVGVKPQELDVSHNHPYIFVTCTEDPVSSNKKGKVYVINYNSMSVINTVYTGYQPHGLAVDDEENLVYVANLNYDSNGPAPHHVSGCGGRNGDLAIINMNTLQLYSKTLSDGNSFIYKNELLSFPYFVSIRH